jgi:hypothetical protein
MWRVTTCALVLLLALAGAQAASAATFTVNDTGDGADAVINGSCADANTKCTLRAAIQESNATVAVPDNIEFAIGVGGLQTIQLTSNLPTVSSPVTIDGYTQTGSVSNSNTGFTALGGTLNIVLDGENFKTLVIDAGSSTVTGLVVQDAGGNGITLQSGDNHITGNYIGTDATGALAVPNRGAGVSIESGDTNAIGGVGGAERNLISGNDGTFADQGVLAYGVWVKHGTGTTIQGNLIGTDATGTNDLGNQLSAVRVGDFTPSAPDTIVGGSAPNAGNVLSGSGGSNQGWGVFVGPQAGTGVKILGNRIGTDVTGTAAIGNNPDGIELLNDEIVEVGATDAGNLISGNVANGLYLNSPGNLVRSNKIGTNPAGTAAVPNGSNGIYANGQTDTKIGGPNMNQRNLISGNGQNGIVLSEAASGNEVQGNFIGTNANGVSAVPNGASGVVVSGGNGNLIGGTELNVDMGGGNLISGNGNHGVALVPAEGPTADDNDVTGNLIGVNFSLAPLGNGGHGVYLLSGNGNVIGGAGTGNTIANNGLDGVFAEGQAIDGMPELLGSRNEISSNKIFSNGGLGIDLGPDGVTDNDAPPDPDTGSNGLQNFPLLHAAIPNGNTTISGTLLSAPNKAYAIQLFSSSTCDPSGHGEGQTPLATVNVTTDGVGYVLFSETVNGAIPQSQFLTATATDAAGNTSEFSPCRQSGTSGDPQARPPDPPGNDPPGGDPPVIPPVTPPVTPPGCTDKLPPVTTLRRPGVVGTGGNVHLSARSTLQLKGTSRDRAGCKSGLRKVEVSLARVRGRTGVNCRFIRRPDRYLLTPRKNCRRPTLFRAAGTRKWKFTFPLRLRPGTYRAQARATDKAGNKETPKKGRNIVLFTVR